MDEDINVKKECIKIVGRIVKWIAAIYIIMLVLNVLFSEKSNLDTECRYKNVDPSKEAYHIKHLDMVNGIIHYREYPSDFNFTDPMGTPRKSNTKRGVSINTRLTREEILEQLDFDEEDLLDYINENY